MMAARYIPKHMASRYEGQSLEGSLGRSTALMGVANLASRLTGFVRTWVMAYALGNTFLTSSYLIANNLPDMLFGLVAGGIISTAFLPVYLEVKEKQGQARANDYVSKLITIAGIVTLIASILGIIFADKVVWLQMFLNDQGDSELAAYFFRFFSIQIFLYTFSAMLIALLNAHRNFVVPSLAPVLNNIVVIITMGGYAVIVNTDVEFAKMWLAVGTTLGVVAQVAVQLPILRRHYIYLSFKIDFSDPAIKETWKIGVPALLVVSISLVTISFRTAALAGSSEVGQSVFFYANLWYNLPYALLAIPITTALFTELSHWYALNQMQEFRDGMATGMRQQLFFTVPFAIFLMAFATPLVNLYHSGAFTRADVDMISLFLICFAPTLPFYAMRMYLNKVFSALRLMRIYAIISLVMGVASCGLYLMFSQGIAGMFAFGILGVALAQIIFEVISVAICLVIMRQKVGRIGFSSVIRTGILAFVLGLIGAVAGVGVFTGLTMALGDPLASVLHTLAYLMPAGLVSLVVTYGVAIMLNVHEARYLRRFLSRLKLVKARG